MVTSVRNRAVFIMMLIALISVACTEYEGLGISRSSDLSILANVTMTESKKVILSSMNSADLAFQNDTLSIYHLNDHRKLVAYKFYEEKLDGIVIYVYKDIINWTNVKSLFTDYETISETSPKQGSYFNREKSLYGEINSVTKDGIEYFCIGFTSIR